MPDDAPQKVSVTSGLACDQDRVGNDTFGKHRIVP